MKLRISNPEGTGERKAGRREEDTGSVITLPMEFILYFFFFFGVSETSKLQTTGRKQSVSRSLKHLFHSSNKFVKTLKRWVLCRFSRSLNFSGIGWFGF